MKVVQTVLSDEEHALLAARAREVNKTMKELVRNIIRSYVLGEQIEPDDSFFKLRFKDEHGERGSEEHDRVLYR